MSSRSYLQGEARWAREHEAKAQGEADDLRDPRTLNHKRDAAAIKALSARLALREALRDLMALSDDRLPETIAKRERDRDHWRGLAEGYEARIAQDEDQPMWGDPQ